MTNKREFWLNVLAYDIVDYLKNCCVCDYDEICGDIGCTGDDYEPEFVFDYIMKGLTEYPSDLVDYFEHESKYPNSEDAKSILDRLKMISVN